MLRTNGKHIALVRIGAVLAGTAWAHSDEENEFPSGHPGMMSDVSRTVDVDMMDNTFNHNAIDIKSGETVRFNVHNKGEEVHEFAIAMPSMHMDRRDNMMQMMGMMNNGRFDADRMRQMGMSPQMPNGVLVEPGESAELIWHFEAMDDVEFACNVLGHYEDGMHGPFMFDQ